MLNLLAVDLAVIAFAAVGVIMFIAVVIGLVKIIHSPARKSDGNTSWDRKAEELAQTMSADELCELGRRISIKLYQTQITFSASRL